MAAELNRPELVIERPGAGLAALTLAYFMQGLASIAVVGLAYPMAAGIGVPPESIARLVMVFSLSYAIAGPLLQRPLARLTRPQRMALALALWIAGALLAALVTSYALHVVSRIMLGAAGSVIGPTASTLAAMVVSPERRQRAIGTAYLGMTVALVAGLPATAQIGALLGWREVFWMMAAIGIAALALMLWLYPMGSATKAEAAAAAARQTAGLEGVRPFVWWSAAATFLLLGGQMLTYALVAVLLFERFGAGADAVALVFLCYGVGGVAGNLLGSRDLKARSVERAMQLAIGVVCAAHLGLWLAPDAPLIAVVYFFAGAASLAFQTRMQHRIIDTTGERADAAMSVNQSALHLGMASGALIGSLLVPAFGPAVLPLCSAAALAAGAAAFHVSGRMRPSAGAPRARQ